MTAPWTYRSVNAPSLSVTRCLLHAASELWASQELYAIAHQPKT